MYASLFAVLRAQGFVAAYAGITLPNIASVGLHEAIGFKRLGVYERVGYARGCSEACNLALSGLHGSPTEGQLGLYSRVTPI